MELLVEGPSACGWFSGGEGGTPAGADVTPAVEDNEALRDIDVQKSELEVSAMRSGDKGG